MSDFDPVILIHGAWQGSWAWTRFTPYLQAAGLAAHAVDLPGNGVDGSDPADVTFEACLQHVFDVVRILDRPVRLVGHSGGGLLVTAFAERWPNHVSRLVYVAGMMLPGGAALRTSSNQSASSIPKPPASRHTSYGRRIVGYRACRPKRPSHFSCTIALKVMPPLPPHN